MGIKSVNKIFNIHTPDAFTLLPLLVFHGYRIAMDGCNWAYQYMAAVHREYVYKMPDPLENVDRGKLIEMLVAKGFEFNSSLMEMGILPVWVWDGEPFPEKGAEKEKRMQDKLKQIGDVKEMEDAIRDMHPLQRTPDVLKKYKEKKSLLVSVKEEEMLLLKQAFACAGLPGLQAPHEGETLCSQLCREGICKATWSTDTDAYATGNTIMLTGYETGAGNQPCFKAVLIYKFAKIIGFTPAQIMDMCILCGCDFNTNIHMIGPAKSYAKIKKYGSIEGMIQSEPQHNYDILNYERCREIFTVGPSGITAEAPSVNFNYNVLGDMGREIFHQYNIDGYFDRFINASRYIPKTIKTVDVGALTKVVVPETQLIIDDQEYIPGTQLVIDDDIVESTISPGLTSPKETVYDIINQLQTLQLQVRIPGTNGINVGLQEQRLTPPPVILLPSPNNFTPGTNIGNNPKASPISPNKVVMQIPTHLSHPPSPIVVYSGMVPVPPQTYKTHVIDNLQLVID